ncbi:hypothetical protein ACWGIU_22095 [Streptomyces sp. NPDC054840]
MLLAQLAIKHYQGMAWVAAERARMQAGLTGNPGVMGEAAHSIGVTMRRSGDYQASIDHLQQAAAQLGSGPEELAMSGTLLLTASSSAAQAGWRGRAMESIGNRLTAHRIVPSGTPDWHTVMRVRGIVPVIARRRTGAELGWAAPIMYAHRCAGSSPPAAGQPRRPAGPRIRSMAAARGQSGRSRNETPQRTRPRSWRGEPWLRPGPCARGEASKPPRRPAWCCATPSSTATGTSRASSTARRGVVYEVRHLGALRLEPHRLGNQAGVEDSSKAVAEERPRWTDHGHGQVPPPQGAPSSCGQFCS